MTQKLKNRIHAFLWGMGSALDLSGGVNDLYLKRSRSDYDAIRGDWEAVGDYLNTARQSLGAEHVGTKEAKLLEKIESSCSEMQQRTHHHTDRVKALVTELAEHLSSARSGYNDEEQLLKIVEAIESELQKQSPKGDDPNQLELTLDDS